MASESRVSMPALKRRGEGFTLIELLIVVAIIAILALIAVPNFLEAQTRAKVSRAKNDLRTIAVAEEAYYVDWNSYTFGQGGAGTTWPIPWEGFRLLTSPIAYITSIPMDPFGLTSIDGERRMSGYELGVGTNAGPAGRSFTDADNIKGMPSNTFELESDGPDHTDDTGGRMIGGTTDLLPSTGSYPTGWMSLTPAQIANGVYDPTNGTVSRGEIFRTGGQVPTGPGLQFLFSVASK